VAQLVQALRYKLKGCEFDSQLCHWNFSLTQSFWPYYGPGVVSASKSNEYQKYYLGGKGDRFLGLTTVQLSCADCLEFSEPQPHGTLRKRPSL